MTNHTTKAPALETEIAELEDDVRRAVELSSTSAAQRLELLERLGRVKQGAIQTSDLRSNLGRRQQSR